MVKICKGGFLDGMPISTQDGEEMSEERPEQ